MHEDELGKSSSPFQWNDDVVIFLNCMSRRGINECSDNSCCVLAFDERRVNID